MKNLLTSATIGLLIGAAITWGYLHDGPPSDELASPPAIERDIVDAPKMSAADAEQLREDRYASLQTIEDIYELPGDFARAEALYVLAGRSDSAALQNLIFDANRIASEEDRSAALNILFFRLTEFDPQSALALARADEFRGDKSHERRVWTAWGRRDLAGALFEARTQTSIVDSRFAAQSLFSAYGLMGNETTDHIEQELGIGPDRSTRGRFLYKMADRSPSEAIAFINQMEASVYQEEFVSWLAHYLSKDDAAYAVAYAEQFSNPNFVANFRQIVTNNAARNDPRMILDRLVTEGEDSITRAEFYSATRALAATDLDSALQYYGTARTAEARQIFGSAIVTQMMREDMSAALAWARENDSGNSAMLERQVLQLMAGKDIDRAFRETMAVENPNTRNEILMGVVGAMARQDPASTVAYLSQIEDESARRMAQSSLVSTWSITDPEAAVGWILQQDEQTAAQLFSNAIANVVQGDLDVALRLLPRMPESQQQNMRMQLAGKLAEQRSAAEAESFVRQFEGQPGYDRLQLAVINSLTTTDLPSAERLAEQMPPGKSRDAAMMELGRRQVGTDPQKAMAWLGTIGNEQMRNSATANVLRIWYSQNPAPAIAWVNNMPAGQGRDEAISRMADHFFTYSGREQRLLESISNPERRKMAILSAIGIVMHSDPARARAMLDSVELTDAERANYEKALNRQ